MKELSKNKKSLAKYFENETYDISVILRNKRNENRVYLMPSFLYSLTALS